VSLAELSDARSFDRSAFVAQSEMSAAVSGATAGASPSPGSRIVYEYLDEAAKLSGGCHPRSWAAQNLSVATVLVEVAS